MRVPAYPAIAFLSGFALAACSLGPDYRMTASDVSKDGLECAKNHMQEVGRPSEDTGSSILVDLGNRSAAPLVLSYDQSSEDNMLILGWGIAGELEEPAVEAMNDSLVAFATKLESVCGLDFGDLEAH